MRKKRSHKRNYFLSTVIPLGIIIVGVVGIGWSLINIREQNRYLDGLVEVPLSTYDSPATYSVKQLDLTTDDIDKKDPDKITYTSYPAEGDLIGKFSIPVLNKEFPIIQGTGKEELKKGVGHFIQSVLPGEEDNCVFSGHRNTVFSELGVLNVGDELIVQTSAGTFTYVVDGARIVDKDDKTVIVPTDSAVLTLTTCYPFNRLDLASQERYIITANLVAN